MSPSETVRYAKQNLTDALAFTGWAVLEETETSNVVFFSLLFKTNSLFSFRNCSQSSWYSR